MRCSPNDWGPVPNPIKILCVDDHEFISEGLAALVAMERDLEFVGRLASAQGLLGEIGRLRPHVVLLDLEMPGPPPLEAMADARRMHPDVAFLVLSGHARDTSIRGAIERGAAGYFSKADSPKSILAGVRRAADGGSAYGAEIAGRMESAAARGAPPTTKLDALSPRELEVLRLIGRGMSRADIARQLCRSHKTIDAHHTAIMRKLDIHDRAELTRYAIREGLVAP